MKLIIAVYLAFFSLISFSCDSQKATNKMKLFKEYLHNVDTSLSKINIDRVAILEDELVEVSGLAYRENAIYALNDSGNKNEIYKLNPETGERVQTIIVSNVENRDWEDLSIDKKYIYIAETGNNLGSHKKMKIYKILISSIGDKEIVKVKASKITFQFEDQIEFENNKNTNFDCEAIAVDKNYIHLFTKEHKRKKSTHYILNKVKKKQKAIKVESYNFKALITSADIKNNTLLLTALTKSGNLFIFKANSSNYFFFKEEINKYNVGFIGDLGQIEAISFGKDEKTVYVASEHFEKSIFNVPQTFYKFKLD